MKNLRKKLKKLTLGQVIVFIFLFWGTVILVGMIYIFHFKSDGKDFISIIEKARLYAYENREGAIYDRYGIEINSDSLVLFADTGMPYDFDKSVDPVIETVKPPWFHEFEFWDEGVRIDEALPLYLYYENGTFNELTAYKTVGDSIVMIPKKVDRCLDFRVTDGKDSNKYFYIFQVSGIVEESDTPFL